MSCAKDGLRTNEGAARATSAPAATGMAMPVPGCLQCGWSMSSGPCVNPQCRGGLAGQVKQRVSRVSRQRIWERTATCPDCGARVSRDADNSPCPACSGTGAITWDGETTLPQQLRSRVVDRARQSAPSQDGYVWAACLFHDLAQDPNVQRMIRAEVKEHPTWALWGHAPDTLVEAGMGDVVQEAAAKLPDAAKVSLRALTALCAERALTT